MRTVPARMQRGLIWLATAGWNLGRTLLHMICVVSLMKRKNESAPVDGWEAREDLLARQRVGCVEESRGSERLEAAGFYLLHAVLLSSLRRLAAHARRTRPGMSRYSKA